MDVPLFDFNKMKSSPTVTLVILILLFFFALVSCSSDPQSPTKPDDDDREPYSIIVYTNSFETPEDTSGWREYSIPILANDPAPDGGERSLHICGGCFHPTAFWYLHLPDYEGKYIFSCWGKSLQGMGGIALCSTESDFYNPLYPLCIGIVIDSDDWIYYETDDTLICSSSDSIYIMMGMGGIFGTDCIAIDMITVYKIIE